MSNNPNFRPEMVFSLQAQVFGLERMDEAQRSPASTAATEQLVNTIQALCSDKDRGYGDEKLRFRRMFAGDLTVPPIALRFNAKGGENRQGQNELANSIASASNLDSGSEFRRFKGLGVGLFAMEEGVIVDDTETALARRVYRPEFATADEAIVAVKPATAAEVEQARAAIEYATLKEFNPVSYASAILEHHQQVP
jgi:hypothetical protein